nr:immunoglobulin light chain junction region [Macaca mulatta]
CQQHISYPPTF